MTVLVCTDVFRRVVRIVRRNRKRVIGLQV